MSIKIKGKVISERLMCLAKRVETTERLVSAFAEYLSKRVEDKTYDALAYYLLVISALAELVCTKVEEIPEQLLYATQGQSDFIASLEECFLLKLVDRISKSSPFALSVKILTNRVEYYVRGR